MNTPSLSVSEFVAVLNQALEYAFESIIIEGELANFRVSKNRWVYFDLKDQEASVKFFGTVYNLPGPLEDGMVLKVRGKPRLHPLYGFSVTVQTIQPAGEGTIRRANELLLAKLEAEGLFDEARKRLLPYPPERIGLITSSESAAYADFMKIIQARWSGVEIELADVQVQGEAAPAQIVEAIQFFNQLAEPPEVLVLIRGGGSAEDLAAFSTEPVTRAVAASRVPTLVAIGHEVDISLAELAADQRASTPSNAAELLVPDRHQVLRELAGTRGQLMQALEQQLLDARSQLKHLVRVLPQQVGATVSLQRQMLVGRAELLRALSPEGTLQRGYAIVRHQGKIVRSAETLQPHQTVELQFAQGKAEAEIIK